MNKIFKEYFQFSQSEKRGVFILLVLIIGGLVYPKVHSKFQKQHTVDYSEFEDKIDKFFALKTQQSMEEQVPTSVLFTFDPNTLDKSGFMELGLSEKVSNTIVNYRNKGGKFKKANDLQNIYGLSEEVYSRLEPFINIVIVEEPVKKVTKPSPDLPEVKVLDFKKFDTLTQEISTIELNTVDSIQLISVSGIGPVFAGRILNYRNYLGGYARVEQLQEIYGFTQEMYLSLSNRFVVDSSRLEFININQADFKAVNKHPYLSFKQTKSIFKYKQLMGDFTNLNQLLDNHLIDSATFVKVKPYLTLN